MNKDSIRGVDLNLLGVFVVVMRERSTTSAAQHLCVSQSAVSQSLRRLRVILDDELFLRDRRGLKPTPRAIALYEDLAPLFAAINGAVKNKADFVPATSKRAFRIRAVSLQGAALMPAILERIQKEAPLVQLEVTVRSPYDTGDSSLATTLTYLDRHEFDLVIGPLVRPIQKTHRSIDCAPVPMMCLYDGKRLGIGSPITLGQYLELPQVVPYFAMNAMTMIDDGLAAIGCKRQFIVVTDDHTAMPFYLKRARAIANFPLHAAASFAKIFDLTASPLPFSTTPYEKSIFWHAKDDMDPGHRWLRELVADVAQQFAEPV